MITNTIVENPGHDIAVLDKSVFLPEKFHFIYEGNHLMHVKYSLRDMSDRKLYKFKMNIFKENTCLSDIKHHSLFKMTTNTQGNDRKKLVIHSKGIDKFIVSFKKEYSFDNDYTVAYYNKMKKRTENFYIYENNYSIEIYYGNRRNENGVLVCKAERHVNNMLDYIIEIAPKIDKTFITLIIINLINMNQMSKNKSISKYKKKLF
ncbi:hypothetical protein PIROE2DRAFT_4941 [Piromyces sp. E2]|nr:hypothetical protein PIROE2DRAFT_4941 [Piromyces sp. E2]|eukprot:OUM67539.1 hypothetical protein PIROE2DRAFT_4941 [Piromyces sp. E2]